MNTTLFRFPRLPYISGIVLLAMLLHNGTASGQGKELIELGFRIDYAKHLSNEGHHTWAAEEYANIANQDDSGNNACIWLSKSIESYIYSREYVQAMDSIKNSWTRYSLPCPEYWRQVVRIGMEARDTSAGFIPSAINQYETYSTKLEADGLRFMDCILKQKYVEASQYKESFLRTNTSRMAPVWNQLHTDGLGYKSKSPLLAAAMSMIIPGAGKFYLHRPMEAFTSLANTATFAIPAYLAFQERGAKSVLGWVCAAGSVSFYISGIYGSYVGAKKFKQDQYDKNRNEAYHLLWNTF